MKDRILKIQSDIASVCNNIRGAVLSEFPDGYGKTKKKPKEKLYCLALDDINRDLQILSAKAGKIIEIIDTDEAKK